MQLPDSSKLPIKPLSAIFNNTSATYKFYWLLSLIQHIENGESKISKKKLFARMISNAWYTVNYFHISFGKQDLIQQAICTVNGMEKIPVDESLESVYQKLVSSTDRKTVAQLWHFDKNVPFRFLSPWFPKKTNETDAQQQKRIYKSSKEFRENCLYALYEDEIHINPDWQSYLFMNSGLLKDFCYWNLALFLQSKNPNVPDIPNKLIKPAVRNSLSLQRTQFWDLVFKSAEYVNCIYTGQTLSIENYALDHFIPYNFVSHDLIWNLIPADKSFNSTKSDKLPSMERHFKQFFQLQKLAVETIKDKHPRNRLLQDYLTIFPDLDNGLTEERFRDCIHPLITIASNNGFEFFKR